MGRLLRRTLLLLAIIAVLPPLAGQMIGWGPDRSVLPERGRSVVIEGGARLHTLDVGSGSPIVLVHGWGSNAADWAGLPESLAAMEHRVISYDRVGYGYSNRDTHDYTYESSATHLRALLDALEIERAALVGWDYGGGIAQTLAADSPHRVSHLILLGSVGPADAGSGRVGPDWLFETSWASPLLRWVFTVPPLSRRIVEEIVLQRFARARSIPTGWTASTHATLQLPGTLRAALSEARNAKSRNLRPHRIATPTLVLHGGDDYVVPYQVGQALHRRMPNSKIESVIDGSHMLPVTHPELVAREIHELVGSRYRAGSLSELEPAAAGSPEAPTRDRAPDSPITG